MGGPAGPVVPSRQLPPSGAVLPGLGFVAVFVAASLAADRVVQPLSPLVVAVVLGVAASNLGLVPQWAAPGSVAQVASLGGRALAVVVVVVTVTFVGTRWMRRRLGLSDGLSMLVAAGYAICGASASRRGCSSVRSPTPASASPTPERNLGRRPR